MYTMKLPNAVLLHLQVKCTSFKQLIVALDLVYKQAAVVADNCPVLRSILAGIDVALNQQQQQQQRGAFGSTGGYVCLLDDDVALHPLSLMQMVDELEADQSLFMVTGTECVFSWAHVILTIDHLSLIVVFVGGNYVL